MKSLCSCAFLHLIFVGLVSSSSGFYGGYFDYEESPLERPYEKNVSDKNIVEISEDVFKKLDSAHDLDALQDMLGIVSKTISPSFSASNDLDLRVMRTDRYLENPKQAHCEPESQPVDLGLINTNDVSYYPTCVRVKQCGGCCPKKDLFSCQPIASKKLVVKVYELTPHIPDNEVSASSRPEQRGKRRRASLKVEYNTFNVTVEEHTDCRCMCQLRESECDLNVHIHNDQTCECICKNLDEEEKCFKKSTHVWNRKTCQCLCRKTITCSSSEQFDHTSCRCIRTMTNIDVGDIFFRSAQPSPRFLSRRKPVGLPFK